MRVTPRITADLDEYPELGKLADAAIRRVVELMQLHDIIELRRIRKVGVFDHPYNKDVVVPLGMRIPSSVAASRHAAGKALLDYLETIGIQGVSIEMTQDDVNSLASLWAEYDKRQPSEQAPAGEAPADSDTSVNKDADEGLSPVKVTEKEEQGKDEGAEKTEQTDK